MGTHGNPFDDRRHRRLLSHAWTDSLHADVVQLDAAATQYAAGCCCQSFCFCCASTGDSTTCFSVCCSLDRPRFPKRKKGRVSSHHSEYTGLPSESAGLHFFTSGPKTNAKQRDPLERRKAASVFGSGVCHSLCAERGPSLRHLFFIEKHMCACFRPKPTEHTHTLSYAIVGWQIIYIYLYIYNITKADTFRTDPTSALLIYLHTSKMDE